MKNKYEVRGDTTVIFLQREGLETIVSTECLEKLLSYNVRWRAIWEPGLKSYRVFCNRKDKESHYLLHRFLMDAPKGYHVDHINHDTLDNRLSNLRLATPSENAQNRKGAQNNNNSSGIRGVHWSKKDKRWRAELGVNRKLIHIGNFKDIEDAVRAVEEARAKLMPFSQEARKILAQPKKKDKPA